MKTERNPARTSISEIKDIHRSIKTGIESQLENFRRIWIEGSDEDVFYELVFCLLTPQSGAYRCWKAVQILREKNLVFNGCSDSIREELNIVRFRNKKAVYICLARELFTENNRISVREILGMQGDVFSRRDWLVKNVKGIGYKEASHYLRNTGFGANIAILDRHILKNLMLLGIIADIPSSMTRRNYLGIENKMRDFSAAIGIPLDHLDFILWYREAGSIFK